MCMACIEAELWAAYQADIARRTAMAKVLPAYDEAVRDTEATTVQAGFACGPAPLPPALESVPK